MLRDANLARRTAGEIDLRQPKVKNLGVSAFSDKDVRGLDVAVDYAFCMGCVEGLSDLDEGLPLLLPDLMDGAD